MCKEMINMRAFAKSLRYLPKVELLRLCKESGMNERETYGVVSYIYERESVDTISENLNMSKGTFQSRKEVLALRFKNYLESIDYNLITPR